MNLAACAALTTTPENRVWFRAIQPQHWPSALQTAHTARLPSRFSPATSVYPAFPIRYLAEDHFWQCDMYMGRYSQNSTESPGMCSKSRRFLVANVTE
jgi:hypothetical protein